MTKPNSTPESNLFQLPEVKFQAHKNGYEIRTEVLEMAKSLALEEYHCKFHSWEIQSKYDPENKTYISSITMPSFPGLDKVLETAEKMYNFVNTNTKK